MRMSPSRYRLRKVFKGPVQRVAAPLIKRDVHPTSVTYLSLFFAFFALLTLLISQNQLLYGIFVFLVGFFDGVDGAVARGTGRASSKGAFTDSVVDKVSEALLLLAIPLSFPSTYIFGISLDIWAFLCLTGWLLTSYTRSRAASLGIADLDVGLGARSERLFMLFLFSLVYLLAIGLVVVTILGLGTALYRFSHYQHQITD